MTFSHAILLFVAAILAGAMNSVAGGGSFFSFPALIFTGVPPIPANATNTVAVWPGSVASIFSYWRRMPRSPRVLIPLVGISLVGGTVGAVILLYTPQATFMRLVPYLFGVATVLFAFGKRLTVRLGRIFRRAGPPSTLVLAGITVAQFAIAVYGGFFGGGIGILMLAMLEMLHLEDIHAMNGLKTVLATAVNGAAIVTFIAARQVVWPQGSLMIVGAIAGGYGGAHIAQKLDPRWVRAVVIAVGAGMTLYFLFWRNPNYL